MQGGLGDQEGGEDSMGGTRFYQLVHTHLLALRAGQQHVEPLGEFFKRVADGETRLADLHRLHHAGIAQLLNAQLSVKQLWAEKAGLRSRGPHPPKPLTVATAGGGGPACRGICPVILQRPFSPPVAFGHGVS